MTGKAMSMILAGAMMALGGCQAQTESDARDVLNMENDAQAVPNDGANFSGNGAASAAPISIIGADGRLKGTVAVSEESNGIRLLVNVEGLPPGTKGMHVHEAGACDTPAFTTAGSHWNPTAKQHGTENPAGAHGGDLPNIEVGADGRGTADAKIVGARLTAGPNPLADGNGAALVIHQQADDYRTDPSGNSGDRIACAVLTG